MTSDEKLDIINSFLTPMVREKFTPEEIEKICAVLYACETSEELGNKIDYYVIEFAHRGELKGGKSN